MTSQGRGLPKKWGGAKAPSAPSADALPAFHPPFFSLKPLEFRHKMNFFGPLLGHTKIRLNLEGKGLNFDEVQKGKKVQKGDNSGCHFYISSDFRFWFLRPKVNTT